jgi:hypothetical protein
MDVFALMFKLKRYTVDCELEGRLDSVWSAARQDTTEFWKKHETSKRYTAHN